MSDPIPRLRVVFADDAPDSRVLLRLWLERHGALEVAAEAADGVEAVELATQLRPDLVLLDVAMPRKDGLEAAREIRQALPVARIVIMSAFTADRMAEQAIDAGADVYLEKCMGPAQLYDVIEELCRVSPNAPVGPPPVSTVEPIDPAEARHRLLLDAIDEGVVFFDREGRVESANFAASAILGIPTSRFVGWRIDDVLAGAVHEDGRPLDATDPDPVREALTTAQPQSGVVIGVVRPEGRLVWLCVNVRPLLTSGTTQPSGALASFTDVTETHRLHDSLAAIGTTLRSVVDVSPAPVAILHAVRGPDYVVRRFVLEHANPLALQLTGWSSGTEVDHGLELFHQLVDALDRGPVPLRGAPWPADAHARRAGDDDLVLSWSSGEASGHDESLRLRAAELLEAAVVSSAVGIALLDRDGRMVVINGVADRLLGGSPLAWDAEGRLPVDLVLAGGSFDDAELRVPGPGETNHVYVKVSGRPVFDADGNPAGAVITVYDDTARKTAEQSLAVSLDELARSNDELEQFAYVASHDLSQPLRVIDGFAQLLHEHYHGRLDADADESLERIMSGVERMRALIDDLLTYSRVTMQARPFEPVDLDALTRDVLELFKGRIADRGAEVTAGPLPTVMADRTQVFQLLQNLVGNALTYVAPGEPPVVQLSAEPDDGGWLLRVADRGIGIPTAHRERAFAMFQRLVRAEDYPGTGIGLAVCRKIVERHGGRIWIEDNAGGGTRVCFTLHQTDESSR